MIIETDKETGVETTHCPLCESSATKLMILNKFPLLICDSCGLGYLSPRPDRQSIAAYYASDLYTPFMTTQKKSGLFEMIYGIVRRASVRWKYRWVAKVAHTRSVVDVGCGTGEFLAQMKRKGWRVEGIEASPEAAGVAAQVHGITVKVGQFDVMNDSDRQAGAVTLWHALEHMHDPVAAARHLFAMVEDGGALLVAVPNRLSLDARLYGRDWVAYDVPRHLYHFTPQSMQRLMNRSGFTLIRYHQMPLDAVFNVLFSEWNAIKRLGIWLLPLLAMRAVIILCATLVFAFITGQGSAVLYTFRKDYGRTQN